MKGIENTTTTNFGDIIGNNRKYVVPLFQRDYSWEEEQWDDLWQDIMAMTEDRSDHYMGYLVLQSSESIPGKYKIIDGQQRFTTITLIVLAIIKAIKALGERGVHPKDNQLRYSTLMQTYIGRQDPVSLEYDNILELNKNDNPYYKDYIVKLGDLRIRGLIASQKLLKNCFEWFENKVNALKLKDEEYAELIVNIVNNLYFTVITVNDEMNAFRVFETLNARGVQLSSADLLKNYLFSLVDDGGSGVRLASLEHKWNQLIDNVKSEKLPDFIRYFWNTRNKNIRSAELFKAVRKQISDASQVFRFVDDMMAYSDIYMALKDPHDALWNHDREVTGNIELLNLFGLRQPYSLLMVAYKQQPFDLFKRILKSIIIISFRYNVICSKNPNDIEKVFNDLALAISKGSQPDLSLLNKIYISDNEFENSFAIKSFSATSRNTKVVRYILGKIESQAARSSMLDIHDDENSIEHILPQNPDCQWNFDEYKIDQLVNRLGNLCLLKKSANKSLGNADYETKKTMYAHANYQTTQSIPEHYNEWTESSINSRQLSMAKKATAIWRLNF